MSDPILTAAAELLDPSDPPRHPSWSADDKHRFDALMRSPERLEQVWATLCELGAVDPERPWEWGPERC